jgi:2,4-dienoyl-CoA reductase-like NADH-dependent reductase (Old Yellow Enzyme family)
MSKLFEPIALRSLTLPNRIVIAPMCQYSAIEGCASDWHIIHLGSLAVSGAGLLILEATAVEARGRITDECLGLYSDACEESLARVLQSVRRYAGIPIGMQLSHAGRKGSTSRLGGEGQRGQLPPEQAWTTIAPSPIPFADRRATPREMSVHDMQEVITAYRAAAERCVRLGFDLIELHSAHGYLLSSFLSPLANKRCDRYGGSLENRMRFPLEVFEAVRAVWPECKPLGVRCNGTDWHEQGITPEEAIAYAQALHARGCDFVDVSSGGNAPARIPLEPGYQVGLAQRVRETVGIPVIGVGLIRDPLHAERIVANGQADMIGIGRGMLNDPRWPWHAAELLGQKVSVPYQYGRAATRAGIPAADHVPAQ